LSSVGVAEGSSFHVGRIFGKQAGDGLTGRSWDRVQVKAVECHHDVATLRPENTVRLRIRTNLVGEEHDPEEAEDEIERFVVEHQVLCVGHLELDSLRLHLLGSEQKDGRIDVCRDNRRLGGGVPQCARDDARTRSRFQDLARS